MGKRWTAEEDDILRKYRPTETIRQLLKRLPSRPRFGIWNRMQKLELHAPPGRNQHRKWTAKELAIVRKYYPTRPVSEIAKRLSGRPIASVQQKIWNLGLRKRTQPPISSALLVSLMRQGKSKCCRCRKIKSLKKFGKYSKAKNGHQNYCFSCARIMHLERVKKNPLKHKKMVQNSHLKMTYGITREERIQKVNAQKGLCAICKKKRKLYVDHCHYPEKLRGMLCMKCNAGLGMFGDSLKNLKNAVRYREKHK